MITLNQSIRPIELRPKRTTEERPGRSNVRTYRRRTVRKKFAFSLKKYTLQGGRINSRTRGQDKPIDRYEEY